MRVGTEEIVAGRPVADPYRWLEDPADSRTVAWQAEQDGLCRAHLDALPGRNRLTQRLAQLHGAGEAGRPTWRGERWFARRREAGRDHAALWTGGPDGIERPLVDPAQLDPEGRTVLHDWFPDNEGRQVAYRISRDGTEEPDLWVLDIDSGRLLDGPIGPVRHGAVAWRPGGAEFFYTRRAPGTDTHCVYRHRVGEPVDSDVAVFGGHGGPAALYRAATSLDGRWLLIHQFYGAAARTDVWLADLADLADPADLAEFDGRADVDRLADQAGSKLRWRPVVVGSEARTRARFGADGRLYLLTDLNAPRGRLVVADADDPRLDAGRTLLAEDETVLEDFAVAGAELLAVRTRYGISEMTRHDLDSGERLGSVPLPGLGTVAGLTEHPDDGRVWCEYTDVVTPTTALQYDAGTWCIWRRPSGVDTPPEVDTRQVMYRSVDGTAVPMLIVAPAGAPDTGAGPRPAILYAYGGFGVTVTAGYSPSMLSWIEAGGVYAVAGVRGGGEMGRAWHRAGIRESKQNTVDDFCAAAEYLIAAGWTAADRLCASGGSNGGLLVGAALTQRPDLFAAVLCKAALLDMVRYERFGLGRLWTSEYGTASDPVELNWLLGYSPYHRVRPGTAYPAVLLSTFDNDTRVDPAHGRKMCAALQHATVSAAPILLCREARAGHGTRPVHRTVSREADVIAFVADRTGMSL